MFENLTQRLEAAFKKLRSRGVLTEKDVKEGLREVRLALLEADVHYGLAKQIVKKVEERATGQEVLGSLTPAQQLIKVLRDELVAALGGEAEEPFHLPKVGKAAVMLVGLQGAGKTTTAGKLAHRLSSEGYQPLMVSTDVQRPAAREQLAQLAEQVGAGSWRPDTQDTGVICRGAWKAARDQGKDTLILDTAGRLHVDDALMEDLRRQKEQIQPDEILLVADAMTGQDALKSAEAFHEAIGLTGVILTKLDGDARGGAVLSLRHATGVPVRFVGVGEKVEDLEPFHPERMVGRILGRGDILTLIEKAESAVDEEDAKRLGKRMAKGEFHLQDFLDQLKMVQKLGPLGKVLEMAGGNKMKGLADQVDERKIQWTEAIILSMTPEERRKVGMIDHSRKKRIARGSGRPIQEVNALLKQFKMLRKAMKKQAKKGGGMPGMPGGKLPKFLKGFPR